VITFKKDLHNSEMDSRMEYNFQILKALGLYGTPTVLINDKPVFDSSSKTEIEKAINEQLEN
jgi:protein-disulfide isomerase